MSESAPRRRAAAGALLLLFAAAIALRLGGLDYLLPHTPEPDAYVVEQARILRAGVPEEALESRVWGKYPHLLARILALRPAPEPPPEPPSRQNLEDHLRAASAPMLEGRRLAAWLSALAVPLTWLLARRFYGPWEALLPAALVATSLLHLFFSQQARPHGPLATLTLAALLGALHVRRSGGAPRAWLLASLLAALALACLHNGAAAYPPLLAAHLLAGGGRRWRLLWKPALALLPGLLILPLFYPFFFGPVGESGVVLGSGDLTQSGHRLRLSWFNGGGFAVIFRDALLAFDPVLLALLLAGAVLAAAGLRRRGRPADRPDRGDLLVVLAFALPYFLAVGLFEKSFERFVLPLLPPFALLAALPLVRLGRARGPRWGVLAAAVALLGPALLCARKLQLNCADDTLERAADWLAVHAPPWEGRLLLDPRLCLPVLARIEDPGKREGEFLMNRVPWRDHLERHPPRTPSRQVYDVRVIETRPQRPGLLNSRVDGRLSPGVKRDLRDDLVAARGRYAAVRLPAEEGRVTPIGQVIEPLAERLVRISPALDPARPGANEGYEKEPMVLRLLRTRAWGPGLEIFEMR